VHLLSETVGPEWIDYNGHLYDGYYAVIFARATDAFLVRIGLDADGRASTGRTIYTLETHVRFLREVKLGASVDITAQLLGLDHKRVRLFLNMQNGAILAATSEQLLICIDQTFEPPRSAAWPGPTESLLTELWARDAALPAPVGAGQSIALKR
jgi:acyl-CoA thioester hydrolase